MNTFNARRGLGLPAFAFGLLAFATGCASDNDATKVTDAPADTALNVTGTSQQLFSVDTASSNVEFYMEAPVENIHGVAKESVHGELAIDPADVTTLRGRIQVDLDTLVIYQAFRNEETGEFKEEKKNDLQNEHMKAWFQISEDAPAAEREKNRWATLTIRSVKEPSATDATTMAGAERKIEATVEGDIHVHGHSLPQKTRIEAIFSYSGSDLTQIGIRSLTPLQVNLAAHELQPRSAFSVLAQKSLSALGNKVSEEAPVEVSFILKPKS